MDGQARLADVAGETGLDFPDEGEATTVGGFVAEHLGKIPQKGVRMEWKGHTFEVTEASARQVMRVALRQLVKGEQ